MQHGAACCPSPAHASRAVAADWQEAPHCGCSCGAAPGSVPSAPSLAPSLSQLQGLRSFAKLYLKQQ